MSKFDDDPELAEYRDKHGKFDDDNGEPQQSTSQRSGPAQGRSGTHKSAAMSGGATDADIKAHNDPDRYNMKKGKDGVWHEDENSMPGYQSDKDLLVDMEGIPNYFGNIQKPQYSKISSEGEVSESTGKGKGKAAK